MLVKETITVVGHDVHQGNLGNGTIRDPGRGLAVEDDLVTFEDGLEITFVASRSRMALFRVENQPIRATIRLSSAPAAELTFAQVDQLLLAACASHGHRHGTGAAGDGEAGIPPCHLLDNDALQPSGLRGLKATHCLGRESEFLKFSMVLPEGRARLISLLSG
ncbi:hypothetical protein FQZ97_967940 [compost metagenome]